MSHKIKFAGRDLEINTDTWASQASGSVLVSFGKTAVLGTATISNEESDVDFLPLTVDYEEKFYACGEIKGPRYTRREGKPTEEAVLTSRLIDRAIRPYFPQHLRRGIQVILTVLSFDGENDPEFPALLAASASLLVSNIPWDGPVAGIRVGTSSEEDFIVNPSYEEREGMKMSLMAAGIFDENNEVVFNMFDGEGDEFSKKQFFSALNFSKDKIETLLSFQKEIQQKESPQKLEIQGREDLTETAEKYYERIKEALMLDKKESSSSLNQIKEELELDNYSFEKLGEYALSKMVLKEGIRPDTRALDEIRNIKCEAGIFSQNHGSAVFERGLTHILSILTLGGPGDELLQEGMEISGNKRFLHHYNFPPYSVGEVKHLGPPGRREIGHGRLAEKALKPLIPEKEDFPYTIRIVSEVMSSNGSTSMGSVCASSLALFDAGVNVKRGVAGISCGLILEKAEKPVSQRDYKILSDIQGPEDSFGDMDLKVASTRKGMTAIQLDVKVRGLTLQILEDGIASAEKAIDYILGKMEEVIPEPRSQLSSLAPHVLTLKIDPSKVGNVIGAGGKVIKEITETTDTSIDIEDEGKITVSGDKENVKKAADWIDKITREIKAGDTFEGEIKQIRDFGLIVEFLPGKTGLLHISEIFPPSKKKDLNDVFKIGQTISVKVKEVGEQGKFSLALMGDPFDQGKKSE